MVEDHSRLSREDFLTSTNDFHFLLDHGVNVRIFSDNWTHTKANYTVWKMAEKAFKGEQANKESEDKRRYALANWSEAERKARKGEVYTTNIPLWMKVTGRKRGTGDQRKHMVGGKVEMI